MKLSIVIVNYNVKYFLEQALRSVRKATQHLDAEVWVVDNNSVDGSTEMVKQRFPEVKLIENADNPGFSKANNQAIRLSQGEYILLLNPDTVVQEDTFEKVCSFMDQNPDCGGLGVRMIDGKGKFLPESKRGLPTPLVAFYKLSGLAKLFPRSKIFGRYHLAYLDEFKTHEVEVLAGAFMALRKSVLDQIGLLDETFFMYGEDIDLSYRITQAGYKNYYFPETSIIHYKGESTKKTSVNYVFVFYRAMVIFAQKHYSSRNAHFFGFFINTAIWFRAGLALVQRIAKKAWLPLLEAALLFLLSFVLMRYWEYNHKGVVGSHFPLKYLLVNVPTYIACWIFALKIAGAYQKEQNVRKVFTGMISGTIAISVLYAFAPEGFRFSRALILLGAINGAILLSAFRIFLHAIKHKNLKYGQSLPFNTVVVGSEEEVLRVKKLLQQSQVPHTFIGFLHPEQKLAHPQCIGRLDQLKEVITIFQVTEVIFCAKDVASSSIIQMMSTLGNEQVNFKIVPEESLYIIGSNSRNTNGELYTIELKMSLAEKATQQSKRSLDILSCLVLLPFMPILYVIQANKKGFIYNWFQVLTGRKTWVSYFSHQTNVEHLPGLRPGVLHPAGCINLLKTGIEPQLINLRYARDYHYQMDIDLILDNLKNLGTKAGKTI